VTKSDNKSWIPSSPNSCFYCWDSTHQRAACPLKGYVRESDGFAKKIFPVLQKHATEGKFTKEKKGKVLPSLFPLWKSHSNISVPSQVGDRMETSGRNLLETSLEPQSEPAMVARLDSLTDNADLSRKGRARSKKDFAPRKLLILNSELDTNINNFSTEIIPSNNGTVELKLDAESGNRTDFSGPSIQVGQTELMAIRAISDPEMQSQIKVADIPATGQTKLPAEFPPPSERDTSKVFVDVLIPTSSDKGKATYGTYKAFTLLDSGSNVSVCTSKVAQGQRTLQKVGKVSARTAGGTLKLESWVQLPIRTRQGVKYVPTAVVPDTALPAHCELLLSLYDFERIGVDWESTRAAFRRGQRRFDVIYHTPSRLRSPTSCVKEHFDVEVVDGVTAESSRTYEDALEGVQPRNDLCEMKIDGRDSHPPQSIVSALSNSTLRAAPKLPQWIYHIHTPRAEMYYTDLALKVREAMHMGPVSGTYSSDQRGMWTESVVSGVGFSNPLSTGLGDDKPLEESEVMAVHGAIVEGKYDDTMLPSGIREPPDFFELYLAEKFCREYLDDNPGMEALKAHPPAVDDTKTCVNKGESEAKMIDIHHRVPSEQQTQIRKMLAESGALSFSPGRVKDYKVEVKLVQGAEPSASVPRHFGPSQLEILREWATNMLASGLYEPASQNVEWCSELLIVGTRDSQGKVKRLRIVGDYRDVNQRIVRVAQYIPNLAEIRRKAAGKKFYAKFDVAGAFNNLEIDTAFRDIFTVRTPLGLIRPVVAPFGPKNFPTKFQRVMSQLLSHLKGYNDVFFVYADDIVFAANDWNQFVAAMTEVVQTLAAAGITLKPSKIQIGYDRVVVLGMELSEDGIRPNPEHVAAVERIQYPTTPKGMQRILGLFNYWHSHIEDFATLTAPLHAYAKEGKRFSKELSQEAKDIIDKLKRVMMEAPALFPFDPELQLYIDTDASAVGIGSVMYHVREGKRDPIAYYSKKLNATRMGWPAYLREAFGLYWTLMKARQFVESSSHQTVVIVDQRALQWIYKAKSPVVVRWVVEVLQQLDFRVVYRRGVLNFAADALSRIPCVAPGIPTEEGEVASVIKLLRANALPDPSQYTTQVIWLSLSGDSDKLPGILKRHGRRVLRSAPTHRAISQENWTFGIVVPEATKAPSVVAKLLKVGKPFAALLPSDMVHMVYAPDVTGKTIKIDDELRALIKDCYKVVYLESGLTWLLFKWPGVTRHEVFTLDARLGLHEADDPEVFAIDFNASTMVLEAPKEEIFWH